MTVALADARHRFQRTADGERFVFPCRGPIGLAAFLVFWLAGWTFGGVMALEALLSGSSDGASLFLLFWLCGWAFGEVSAALALWQMAFGREIIELSDGYLRHTAGAWPFERTRAFDMTYVRRPRMRVDELRPPPRADGALIFDYGGGPVFIGADLTTDEAALVVAHLQARLEEGERAALSPRLDLYQDGQAARLVAPQ